MLDKPRGTSSVAGTGSKAQTHKLDVMAKKVTSEFQRAARVCVGGMGTGGSPLAIVTVEEMELFLRNLFITTDFGQGRDRDKSDDDNSDDTSSDSE